MSFLRKVKIFDSSLRDGSHAVKQQLFPEQIEAYCDAVDGSGLHTVIVGHGNGLGASSIQMGLSAMDEVDMVRVAHNHLKKTRLGTFVTVGFGTIEDHIKPAMACGTEVFCIATHCTESDTMRRHVQYVSRHGKEVYGVLMNCHLTSINSLVEQAKNIASYGGDGVILMDSAGTFIPDQISRIVEELCNHVDIDIGFHAHNNLSMAVANSYAAISSGASIIDGTVLGFGAGAGNCQLEALIALMEKNGIRTGIDLYRLMDAGKNVISGMMHYDRGIDGTCIISGYAGVVSTFRTKVEYIAKMKNVDPRDVFLALGERKAIAGQDDLILEVANHLAEHGKRYGGNHGKFGKI